MFLKEKLTSNISSGSGSNLKASTDSRLFDGQEPEECEQEHFFNDLLFFKHDLAEILKQSEYPLVHLHIHFAWLAAEKTQNTANMMTLCMTLTFKKFEGVLLR